MKYLLLLFFTVKTIYGFGFGLTQSLQPFHMQFEMPAMPISLMSPMQFPAIFNPMEAMQRETVDPEARGMDAEEPMANITTKNQTEIKDGFKITTITKNGPGFHSYIKEYEKDGNDTSRNGTGLDFAKMMGGSSLFKIMQQLRNGGKPHERKCKKCGKTKFCDPIFHLCRKKFAEGRTCMFQKQCGNNLKCQWGKCQKAKRGDPGTFCKGNSECNGDACCRNTPGSFHLMCIPRQAEGAICGLKKDSFADVLYIVKRSTAPSCSPCQDGLKCADTGGSEHKRCVKVTYVEGTEEEISGDNPTAVALSNEEEKSNEKLTLNVPRPQKAKSKKAKAEPVEPKNVTNNEQGDTPHAKGKKIDKEDFHKGDYKDDSRKEEKGDAVSEGILDDAMAIKPHRKKKSKKNAGKDKRCVKCAYVEKSADELEDDNPSNALDDDEVDDDESGDANNKVDEAYSEKDNNAGGDDDDNDDDKDKDKDKSIKQGVNGSMPIKTLPKKKKHRKQSGNSKTSRA